MLPIIWRASARADLAAIIRYIAEHDIPAARRLKSHPESVVLPLAEHPYLYRPGRVPGTRELVAHPNFILLDSSHALRGNSTWDAPRPE